MGTHSGNSSEEPKAQVNNSASHSRSASPVGSSRGGSHSCSTTKRTGHMNVGGLDNLGPSTSKKKRITYDYKISLWDCSTGQQKPISLADWKVINNQITRAATKKLKDHGPPQGGVGLKHWQEHYDGKKKTCELPDNERFGHAVIRFTTVDAQNWYHAVASSVLGTAEDGSTIKLSSEIESKEGRARYIFTLPETEFNSFGNTKEEREDILKFLIYGATGMSTVGDSNIQINAECSVYSSFLFQEKNRENIWKMGMKFPFEMEYTLDSHLKGEKFCILPTAITGVGIQKRENSKAMNKKLSQIKTAADGNQSKGGRSNNDGGSETNKAPGILLHSLPVSVLGCTIYA